MYPPFSPVVFQIGSFALHWYGIIIVVAILAAAWVASRYVTRHGQNSTSIRDILLWVLIPALIGERLYYVFIQSPRGPNGLGEYLAHPIEILEIWRGGMHIYGAFIFGGIAIALYARWRKLPLLIYLDAVGLALPLGQAIGRWANFINQELYGPPTTLPWGLRIDPAHRVPPYNDMTLYPESVRFQPLFLYESLANLIGFALIFWISRRFEKRLRDGDLFLIYLIWYPLVRFWLEFFRTDSWFFSVLGLHFNVVHILSVITIVAAATILFIRHRTRPQIAVVQGTGDTPLVEDREIAVVEDEAEEAHSPQDNGAHVEQLKDVGAGNKDAEVTGSEADVVIGDGVKAES
jgi:phosphatidylglycerol:prolipoprotein diacylglycerol transferase